jgi:iodotyrosine deiodinase
VTPFPQVPLQPFRPPTPPAAAASAFFDIMNQRRSVRMFSDRPVEREVIESCVRAAGTAPSGANKQPWRFVAVADPDLKRQIRDGAEAEEREFYARRAGRRWLEDLAPLGTDADKQFLEVAPWLVVLFKMMKTDDGGQVYYANESVGIAAGLFLAAIHHAGLAALTHTPSPMAFLAQILGRPAHERPFLLIPVGHPAEGCTIPDIQRKPLDQILVVHEVGRVPTP